MPNIVITIDPATLQTSHSSLAGVLSVMSSFTGILGTTQIGRLDVTGGAVYRADTGFLNVKITTNAPDAKVWEVNIDKSTTTGYNVATVTTTSGLFTKAETDNFSKLVNHCVGLAEAGLNSLTIVWTYV